MMLQVKNQAGQWINASPIPGTLVCNLGDMLKASCRNCIFNTPGSVLVLLKQECSMTPEAA